MDENIVLCGFMGCGKTTIGKKLAKLMNREFYDLDKYIEQKEGMTVSEIFAQHGEEGFRQRETQAVREISQKGNAVVACGGGTVLFRQNVEEFHAHNSVILLLYVPLVMLQDRLKNDKKRPLLQKPNRNQVIADLYKQRISLYRSAADITVRATAPVQVVVKRIANMDFKQARTQKQPHKHIRRSPKKP